MRGMTKAISVAPESRCQKDRSTQLQSERRPGVPPAVVQSLFTAHCYVNYPVEPRLPDIFRQTRCRQTLRRQMGRSRKQAILSATDVRLCGTSNLVFWSPALGIQRFQSCSHCHFPRGPASQLARLGAIAKACKCNQALGAPSRTLFRLRRLLALEQSQNRHIPASSTLAML